jgi:hypothetical protein
MVFWQTWSCFLGMVANLAIFLLLSKCLLADVEPVLWHGSLLAFDVLLSKGLLADKEPVF